MGWHRRGGDERRPGEGVEGSKFEPIYFEDFMLWYQSRTFLEDLLQVTPRSKENREIARELELPIPDVETIRREFSRFDTDGSGHIDRTEFRALLCALLRVKDASDIPPERISRYWLQIDTDQSGEVSFREFVPWYMKFFYQPAGASAMNPSPMSAYYAQLGSGRFNGQTRGSP